MEVVRLKNSVVVIGWGPRGNSVNYQSVKKNALEEVGDTTDELC
jgi:hypothetical protein